MSLIFSNHFLFTGFVVMPRAKIWGYCALLVSVLLGFLFIYAVFVMDNGHGKNIDLNRINNITYIALIIPIVLVAFPVLGTGFWIGWTILTIKVVPPMPEIVEKKDYSKIKAYFLCMITLAVAVLLVYGLYIRSFWALALPATVISVVILGAVFWVGIAIITTRATLPDQNKES